MKEKCSLDKLPLGVTGIVYRVNCNENIKNRIFDFGIMENSKEYVTVSLEMKEQGVL